MPTVPVAELTRFCEAILEGAGVPRHKAADRGRLPDFRQPARRGFARHPTAAVLHRPVAGRRDGPADRRPRDFRERQLPAFRRAERAGPMGGGDLLRARRADCAAARAGAGGGQGIEPLRRGRVVGAEDARRRTDRHRDVQRFADRAAVAGQERPVGHQPDLHVGARSVAARYGHHDGGGGQGLQGVSQRAARDSGGLGVRFAKACPPPTRRPPTRAC